MIIFNENGRSTYKDEAISESVCEKAIVKSRFFESGFEDKNYVTLDIYILEGEGERERRLDCTWVEVTGKTEEEISDLIIQRLEYGEKIAPLFVKFLQSLPAEGI